MRWIAAGLLLALVVSGCGAEGGPNAVRARLTSVGLTCPEEPEEMVDDDGRAAHTWSCVLDDGSEVVFTIYASKAALRRAEERGSERACAWQRRVAWVRVGTAMGVALDPDGELDHELTSKVAAVMLGDVVDHAC